MLLKTVDLLISCLKEKEDIKGKKVIDGKEHEDERNCEYYIENKEYLFSSPGWKIKKMNLTTRESEVLSGI